MPYATAAQVRGVLVPDPAQGENTAAALNDVTLDDRVSAAQAEVDAALSARYPTPFPDDAVPRLVRDITAVFAAYSAAMTVRREADVDERDPVWLRYQDAKTLLKQLRTGEIDLPVQATEQRIRGSRVVNRIPAMFGAEDFGLDLEA